MRKCFPISVICFTCVHKTLGKATIRLLGWGGGPASFSAVVEDFVKLETEVQ